MTATLMLVKKKRPLRSPKLVRKRGVPENSRTEKSVDIENDSLGRYAGAKNKRNEEGDDLDAEGRFPDDVVVDFGPDQDPEEHQLPVKVHDE